MIKSYRTSITSLLVVFFLLTVASTASAAPLAYTANNNNSGTQATQFATGSQTAIANLDLGSVSTRVVFSNNGQTAYFSTGTIGGSILPVNTADNTLGTPSQSIDNPLASAIAPNGQYLYVVAGDGLHKVDLQTGNATLIAPFTYGYDVAITPDGTTAYVTTLLADQVIPVDLTTDTAQAPITVTGYPGPIAITPDGTQAYVGGITNNSVTPIDLTSNTVGTPISIGNLGTQVRDLVVAPSGGTVWVATDASEIVEIDTLTNTVPAGANNVGFAPVAIAMTPKGDKLFLADSSGNYARALDTDSRLLVGNTTSTGDYPNDIAIQPAQPPVAAFSSSPSPADSQTSFDASASTDDGSIVQYTWDYGDGFIDFNGGVTPTHTFAQPGDYTVRVLETDDENCSIRFIYNSKQAYCNGGGQATITHVVHIDAPTPPQSVPAAPVLSGTNPVSGSDNNAPHILGSVASDDADSIKVYSTTNCSGLIVASGTEAELEAAGVPVVVADNSSTTLSVKSSNEAGNSACSNAISYAEVTPDPPVQPVATITFKPINPGPKHSYFAFKSSVNPAVFECQLDNKAWKLCFSKKDYPNLKNGVHNFRVRATANGLTSDTVSTKFRVKRPHTHFTR